MAFVNLKGNLAALPREAAPTRDLERAFRYPPVSWEQVLHPEKYWNEEARGRIPQGCTILNGSEAAIER